MRAYLYKIAENGAMSEALNKTRGKQQRLMATRPYPFSPTVKCTSIGFTDKTYLIKTLLKYSTICFTCRVGELPSSSFRPRPQPPAMHWANTTLNAEPSCATQLQAPSALLFRLPKDHRLCPTRRPTPLATADSRVKQTRMLILFDATDVHVAVPE